MSDGILGTMSFFKGKSLIVTGGAGFLGRKVLEALRKKGADRIFVPEIENYDLRKLEAINNLYEEKKPQIVIHLAAIVGGIGFNREYPATLFYDNLIMGIQLMEQARVFKVEKFLTVGTICAYPKFSPAPFKEEALWDGYPEETNAPYGLAKKMLLVQSQAYRNQYDFNAVYLLPVNLFGPEDNFDPDSSHVIPAIIKKCFDAVEEGADKITLWGDGSPTREFLYVDDCAEGIALACEKYSGPEPVNLGTGQEIAIKDLAGHIAELTGFKGKIIWDKSKPNGQPRRVLDVSKAGREFGFRAKTSLEEGLKKTVTWYRKIREKASS